MHDVTVKNIYLRGIYASSGGSFNFTNDTVDNVQADPASIGMFNFGGGGVMTDNHVSDANDAISANHSRGTPFTNNVVTTSGSGVHTDNAGDSGGTADLITGNTVTTCTAGGYGVWAFVPYLAADDQQQHGVRLRRRPGRVRQLQPRRRNNCPGGVIPTVTFSTNNVAGNGAAGGAGLYVSTNSFGFGDGDVNVTADHNGLAGAETGVAVEETGTAHATTTISRNSLAGTSLALANAGATTVDARCNWWGQPSPDPVANGLATGPVTMAPWLQTSDLNGNCIPITQIGVFPAKVAEGDSGTTALTFAITLDRPSSTPVTVMWDTVNGTTVAGSDFVGASNVLVTFSPNQVLRFITVNVNGDTQVEPKEKFTVHLHNASGAFLANNTKHMTILNDD